MLIACKDRGEIEKLKVILKSEFDMKDLGVTRRILGIDIIRDRKRGILKLTPFGYLKKVVKLFGMSDCKAVSTPIPSHYRLSAVKGELSKEDQ